MLCPAHGISYAFCVERGSKKLAGRNFQCDGVSIAQMDPKKGGFKMNEGLVWLVWIPVSVILLVLLINTFIIV
jgi:hypothetical protein